MKMKLFLKNKKAQRGVALIFTLGILGLMVVLALTFASLSFTDQSASRSTTERFAAKMMAKSAVERVIAVLENNNTITDPKLLVSGGDPENTNHFDFLWKLITYHGDVPGAGEMQAYIERCVKTGTNSPYWQYVRSPDLKGNEEIVGRFAYMVYMPVGLLDPISSAMTASEGTTPIERPGMTPDEIDLSALVGVQVKGSSASLTVGDFNKLGGHNADTSYPDVVTKPADLFSRFTDASNTGFTKNARYAALRDKVTSAWFSVPRAPAQPERYSFNDRYYPRFNLNRTPEEWDLLTLDDITKSDKMVFFETLDAANADSFNAGTVIPWFMKDDDETRQIAANFLAYFSPMPVSNFEAKQIWGSIDETAAYTGNMRTPYINDVLIDVNLNMTVSDSGDEDLPSYTKTFTVTITPKIDIYIELADLYGKSLNDMGLLTFKIPTLLKSLKTTDSTNASIVYTNGDMAAGNANLKSAEFQCALNSKINTGTLADVYPVFKHEITGATPFTAKITVNVTREAGADGVLGAPKCDAVEFTEALSQFVMDKITILMSAKPGANTIPVDLANIAAETSYPVLGEKVSDRIDFSSLPPFKLNINDAAGYADEEQKIQERHVFLRYRAIDSAANLKLEHWVEAPVEVKTTSNDVSSLGIGSNNIPELKTLGLLSITSADSDNYKKMTVQINGDESKTFFVDVEEDPADANATTGYGGVLSTSYIRGRANGTKQMLSPWEVGFIHRGLPYQTLNIKYYKKDASEIGSYVDGDANLFDYVKVTQRETDNSVKDTNRLQMRGQVNLKNVSRQNGSTETSGNLPAAKAFFSRIELGWLVKKDDDSFDMNGSVIGTGAGSSDNTVSAQNIVNALVQIVDKPNFILRTRSAILDPSYTDLQKYLVTGTSDAAREELIGKFILLTSADTTETAQFADFMIVVAIAQRIKIGSASVPEKDWLRDGTFSIPSLSGTPGNRKTENALIEAGYGYRDVLKFWCFDKLSTAGSVMNPSAGDLTASDRKLKFYPGYDKILSTQKVVAWLRKNDNGKWYIERLDYVD